MCQITNLYLLQFEIPLNFPEMTLLCIYALLNCIIMPPIHQDSWFILSKPSSFSSVFARFQASYYSILTMQSDCDVCCLLQGILWDRMWIAPSIGIFSHTCWFFYRNANHETKQTSKFQSDPNYNCFTIDVWNINGWLKGILRDVKAK